MNKDKPVDFQFEWDKFNLPVTLIGCMTCMKPLGPCEFKDKPDCLWGEVLRLRQARVLGAG